MCRPLRLTASLTTAAPADSDCTTRSASLCQRTRSIPLSVTPVAADMGLTDLATLSTGEKIHHPRDWERPGADAIVAAVQQQIAQQAPDGPIVLLHDGGGDREQTAEALERLIPWLVEQGYRFGFPVP